MRRDVASESSRKPPHRQTLVRLSSEGTRIPAYDVDSDNTYSDSCEPLATIPAWWAGFFFHVLNPRQLSVYLYLSLLCVEDNRCHPTTKQIRQDLGIASLTIVFDAISALEANGFILRRRQNLIELKSRRNVYQRPSCEYTILRLLELGRIDAMLRPTPGNANEMSSPAQALRDEWLACILGDDADRYAAAELADKRDILTAALIRLVRVPKAVAAGNA